MARKRVSWKSDQFFYSSKQEVGLVGQSGVAGEKDFAQVTNV